MKKNNGKGSILCQDKPWSDNEHLIWLVSTVSLARNIEKYNFPSKLDVSRQKQIVALVKNQIPTIKALKKAELLNAEEVNPLEKEFLVEHFLTTQSFSQSHAGEGFLLDGSGRFLTTVNNRDHLNLLLLDCNGELETSWNQLVEIERGLGEGIPYSYSQKFGFLTVDPMNCGTGLRVSAFLQLSGLIHSNKIDDALNKYTDESIVISGIHGSPTEIIGDIIVVQNNYSLGITEENIISTIRTCCTKLQAEEKTARKKILESNNADIKDRVSRAYGILVHSYNIEAVEALNALSLLKLGIQFNWITGITIKEINRLFFNCRRAHLINQFKEEIPQEELIHKRAEYIHQNLKGVELKI